MANQIEDRLKLKAREIGFELVGIARATSADGFDRYSDWLDRGYAGEMNYLHHHAEARRHPSSILAEVRSVIMVGVTYAASGAETDAGGARSVSEDDAEIKRSASSSLTLRAPPASAMTDRPALVAKYAQAPDYHEFLWERLNQLGDWLESQLPGSRSRGIADSAPLLERDFARRAGLGWIGKNTMLINKRIGSFFVLGALLTTAELEPDQSHPGQHCGTCTACLDACPTDAFTAAGWLDARRCISYLTIELKSSIAAELRPNVGDWLFGCDICQDVCPWNRRGIAHPGLPTRPELAAIDPIELLSLSPEKLRRRFKGTPLRRANWRGLLRNAAIVLGNRGDPRALPALHDALKWEDEVVREACEWAIVRIEENHG